MTTYRNLSDFFNSLDQRTRRAVPQLVAETAVEFYKERFRQKQDPDGNPWPETKKAVRRGSLMLRSGKLMNSIRPSVVTTDLVRISAGNAKVPYAQIHNEGGTIQHPGGTAYAPIGKDKKFAWVSNKRAAQLARTGRVLPRTKAHSIPMPKRQFMGHSKLLNERIQARIIAYMKQG